MMSCDDDTKRQNLLDALPGANQEYLSAFYIWDHMARPRMSLPHTKAALRLMADRNEIDFITIRHGQGVRYAYRRKPRVSRVATVGVTAYNGQQRNKFSLDEKVDRLAQTLFPLRRGKPVLMWMNDPVLQGRKNFRGKTRKLLSFHPGTGVGFPDGSVIVSVFGSGSCVVWAKEPTKIANLVLAGVPVKLAEALIGAIHQVFKE